MEADKPLDPRPPESPTTAETADKAVESLLRRGIIIVTELGHVFTEGLQLARMESVLAMRSGIHGLVLLLVAVALGWTAWLGLTISGVLLLVALNCPLIPAILILAAVNLGLGVWVWGLASVCVDNMSFPRCRQLLKGKQP